MRTRRARGEAGVTLLEMLVCLSILGIIFAVLATAVMEGLVATQQGDVKTDESNAAQFTAMYFTHDVQGAETVSVNDTAASCGGAALLKLLSPVADRTVAYVVTGSPLQLVRRVCSPAAATPLASTLVPTLTNASNVTVALTPTGCTTACTKVTLTVNQPGATGIVAGLTFTVTGSPRV